MPLSTGVRFLSTRCHTFATSMCHLSPHGPPGTMINVKNRWMEMRRLRHHRHHLLLMSSNRSLVPRNGWQWDYCENSTTPRGAIIRNNPAVGTNQRNRWGVRNWVPHILMVRTKLDARLAVSFNIDHMVLLNRFWSVQYWCYNPMRKKKRISHDAYVKSNESFFWSLRHPFIFLMSQS